MKTEDPNLNRELSPEQPSPVEEQQPNPTEPEITENALPESQTNEKEAENAENTENPEKEAETAFEILKPKNTGRLLLTIGVVLFGVLAVAGLINMYNHHKSHKKAVHHRGVVPSSETYRNLRLRGHRKVNAPIMMRFKDNVHGVHNLHEKHGKHKKEEVRKLKKEEKKEKVKKKHRHVKKGRKRH